MKTLDGCLHTYRAVMASFEPDQTREAMRRAKEVVKRAVQLF
jgi:hypothetical protein